MFGRAKQALFLAYFKLRKLHIREFLLLPPTHDAAAAKMTILSLYLSPLSSNGESSLSNRTSHPKDETVNADY
jgi:hypothetical protein